MSKSDYKAKILEEIKRLVLIYNSFDKDDQLEVNKKTDEQDVSDVYVCWYDDEVGLFKEFSWVTSRGDFGYDAGSIYTELNGSNIGIKMSHNGHSGNNEWLLKDSIRYVYSKKAFYEATCNMYDAKSFDEIRKMMKENGMIKDYTLGIATPSEMDAVLEYAKKNISSLAPYQRVR